MSKKHLLKSWLVTTLLIIASALPASANAVANGGFEEGLKGWWGPALDKKTAASVPGAAAEGAASLNLQSGWLCQDKRPVEGGCNYKVSMQIRCDGTAPDSVYAQLSFRGGGLGPKWYGPLSLNLGDHDEAVLFSTGAPHGWRKFEAVVAAPASATEVLIYLRKSNATGSAFFDGVSIEQTDEVVPMRPLPAVIVSNGGFEDGIKDWWGSVGKDAIVKEGAAEGNAALKLASGWVCQDKRYVQGGRNYRISMKIKTEGAPDNAAYVQLSFRGAGVDSGWRGVRRVGVGGRAEPVLYATGGTTDWQDFSTVLSAPKGADQVLLYLRKQEKSEGHAMYDAIKIEPTDEAPVSAASLRRDELAAKWLAPAGVAYAAASRALPSTPTLTLAENGKAKYKIYAADPGDVASLNAAVELAQYLERITGASFTPLAHDRAFSDGPFIIVGRSSAFVKELCPSIPFDTLGKDGFVIRTVGPHLVIAGATPRGTMYGVNWFLDHQVGVKWFAPDFTVVPIKTTLAVNAVNEIQVPRFKYREVFSSEGHDDFHTARNLLNGRSHGRSFSPSAPELGVWESWWTAKGGDANFWTLLGEKGNSNPGWKSGGQVAMMNNDVRQTMADEIIARLRSLEDYRSVAFNIHDMDWGWDMDAASKAFADKHGGVPSAPRLDMVIDIADRVRKVLPDARFTFNPYHWSFTPPQGMTVPDYIIPFPMTIHVDYSAPLFGEPNKKLAEDLLGWTKISKNVLVWDHTVNFFGFLQPTPNIYPICQSIQWLSTLDPVMGYFAEDSWMTPGAEHAALRTWVIARLLWNPKQDYKALVKEFVDGYYGPAAPFMMQYIALSHGSMAKTGDTLREKTTVLNKYVNLDFVMEADQLFEKAHDAVKTSPQFLRHVETTRMAVDCPVLIRRAEFVEEARKRGLNWTPDTEARSARLFANWEAARVREYIQGGNLKELKDLLTIERKTPEAPDLAKGLAASDWIDFQDLAFTRYGSKIVADPAASDGAAIRLDGNNSVWAAQLRRYKLPREGNWDLYAAVRIDKGGKGTDADAAVNIGLSPPMGRFNSGAVGELGDGTYHWIKVPRSPMNYAQGDEHLMYVQPRSGMTKYIYIDRVVAIRHKP